MVPPGFTLHEQTGQYYSPDDGGIYFDPSTGKFFSVRRNAYSDRPTFEPPANGAAPLVDGGNDSAPGAANGPAPSGIADANALVAAYNRLPTSERMRFCLLLDEYEESFDRAVLQRLERALSQARVNKFDRRAYDSFFGTFNPDRTVEESDVPPARRLGTANGSPGRIRGGRGR